MEGWGSDEKEAKILRGVMQVLTLKAKCCATEYFQLPNVLNEIEHQMMNTNSLNNVKTDSTRLNITSNPRQDTPAEAHLLRDTIKALAELSGHSTEEFKPPPDLLHGTQTSRHDTDQVRESNSMAQDTKRAYMNPHGGRGGEAVVWTDTIHSLPSYEQPKLSHKKTSKSLRM